MRLRSADLLFAPLVSLSLAAACSDASTASAGADSLVGDSSAGGDASTTADDVVPSDVSTGPGDDVAEQPDALVPDSVAPDPDVTGEEDVPVPSDVVAPDGFVWTPDEDTLPVFETGVVKTLTITLTAADFDGLMACWSKPSAAVLSGDSKCWYKCTASLEGQTSVEAGCRPKGSPKKWDEQFKPQLIVKFDEYDKSGRFFGLRRLNLEASPDHAAPVRDQLGMWFMREAGLPTPRAALVRVVINGQPYGPYQQLETIDKEFLSDHFEDPEGDLYDDDLELVTNEKTSDGSRLGAFLATAEGLSPGDDFGAVLADLDTLADVDAFVRHVAAELTLGTVDNFSDGAGNTYFYDRIPTPGLVPIPWDLDDIFSKWSAADEPLDSCQGPSEFADEPLGVCTVLQNVPATRAALRAEVKRLRDEVFPGLSAELAALCTLARPEFLADPKTPFSEADFDADCAAMQTAIAARAAWLAAAPELQ